MSERITLSIATAMTMLLLFLASPLTIHAYASTDTTKPTLTAVVNNGMLTVDAADDESGIAAIYVNGYEFTELTNGSITIRMQQYDTGYQYFTMMAKDGVGNVSDVYRVNNPYYDFGDDDDDEDSGLPNDATPTEPSNSEASVTDHVKTDGTGTKTDQRSSSSSTRGSSTSSSAKSSSSSSTRNSAIEEYYEDDDDYLIDAASHISDEGREFYTIMTKGGKVFYLVIDRTGDEEKVHFLTDVSERDLLNVTEDNKPTLPQNSAIVVRDAGLADMSAGAGRDGEESGEEIAEQEDSVSVDDLLVDEGDKIEDEEPGDEEDVGRSILKDSLSLIIGGIAAAMVATIYIFKKHGKGEDYEEDEEADDDDDEDYPDDDDEEERDFFATTDDDEADQPSEEEGSEPQASEPIEREPGKVEYKPFPDEEDRSGQSEDDPYYEDDPYEEDQDEVVYLP